MEEEFEQFDPQHLDVLPHDFREIEQCIDYANNFLQVETTRSLPKWNSQVTSHLDLLHFSQLSVDIPKGSFFYPCSGNDFNLPIKLFSKCVNEFNFADTLNLKYGQGKDSKQDMITKEIPWIGRIAMGKTSKSKRVIDGSNVFFHRKDGLLTLLEDIFDLTIFFYRGDSGGEGGSGQLWQGPVLLDYVLMRIQNGGLLCTDDSNGFGPLFNELRKSNQVDYRNVTLRRLSTENLSAFSNVKIWQVTKHQDRLT